METLSARIELLPLPLSQLAVKLTSAASYVETKVHNYQTIATGELQKESFCIYILVNIHLRVVTYAKSTG